MRDLHRAHLLNISYENLDLHAEPRRALSLDVAHIYDKIVHERRGGWCYEMNGLFAWVLREIGFEVRLLGSAVGRLQNPGALENTHLLLHVLVPTKPDEAWIADVGFGNAFLEPLPLRAGDYGQDNLTYRLEQDNTGRWWFTNQMHGGAGYDFDLRPFELDEFAAPCQWLQTAPESGFVRVAVCHRHVPGGLLSLRALTLTTINGPQRRDQVIQSHAAYARTIQHVFDLNVSDFVLRVLWQRASEMHAAWLA